jgi:hypothetical protein
MPHDFKGKKPKLSKAERAILSALPEPYQRALLYFHQAGVEDALEHGRKPMPLAQVLQVIIRAYFTEARDRDSVAHTAVEILVAPDFIESLNAEYQAWVAGGRQ